MGIFSDVLLTVDYDRTLTAPDSTIPQRNLDAIRFFMENGGAFTVNTGRSVPMYRPMQDRIPVNAPVLLYNGSAAYDPKSGRLSRMRPIELPMADTIRELLKQFPDLTVEVQGVRAHFSFLENAAWNAFSDRNHCTRELAEPEDDLGPFLKFSLYGSFTDDTVDSLFHASPEETARMDAAQAWVEQRFAGKVVAFRAAPKIIDCHAYGVSKAVCARDLQKKLGRKILVVAGDTDNDIPMMIGADYAFSPADGALADRFPNVCPCADGAVADVIYKKIPDILDIHIDKYE